MATRGDEGQGLVTLALMSLLALTFGGVGGWTARAQTSPTVVQIPGPVEIRVVEVPVNSTDL